MNGKWLSWLLIAVGFQAAGCWTVHQSEEARHWPVFPANPDGVCPEVATGVYPHYPKEGGGAFSAWYFGSVEREDESLKGVKVPESWPKNVVSVERIGTRNVKMGVVEYTREIGTLSFVKGFRERRAGSDGNDVFEVLCDEGVYYGKRAGMGNRGIDRAYMEFVTLVSKGANEEIILKSYTKMNGWGFGVLPLGGSRRVNTYRYTRISDKPLDFDALR